ncbi:GNAT family N-acetyltransferase [Thiosocius teredinicola]|uniref:GNAT family N-acetyltransferase n=1 Tax=Thiosocius teredinicola TaxID=1973002 RepID=UPI000990A315
MTEEVTVRRIRFDDPADARQYVDLLDAYARDPMGGGTALPDEVRERLPGDLASHPTAHGLFAEIDAAPVGFATCFLGYSTFRAQPLLNIHDIAVLPTWRGRSVAKILLEGIVDLARSLDCCRVTLEVREDNPRAQSVYRAAGFSPADCSLFMTKSIDR